MDQKQQIADRLKQSNNILVTVSNNPSVDQLSACIGLTLALNKLGKHATAVFSGNVPSTIEFLQPEKTIEKNTDSLRDFIIALDKAKADKLRYKVEDKVVKIFITPYRTSISQKDLDFSQGDFNVDVVLALGVHNQNELDQAITSHGRILHDAVVATINLKQGGELGSLNWIQPDGSSLSELVVELMDIIDKDLMDGQMATAFLTGIVAETERFSNEKTSPMTMSISAELMAAGANQQLVATKLAAPPPPPPPPPAPERREEKPAPPQEEEQPKPTEDGTLEITHPGERADHDAPTGDEPQEDNKEHQEEHREERRQDKPQEEESQPRLEEPEQEQELPLSQIHIDDNGEMQSIQEQKPEPKIIPDHKEPMLGGNTDPVQHMGSSHSLMMQPPSLGAMPEFTASGNSEEAPSGAPMLPQPTDYLGGGTTGAFNPPASAITASTNVGVGPNAIPGFGQGLTAPPAPTPPVVNQPEPAPQPAPPMPPAPEPEPAPAPPPPPAEPADAIINSETLSNIEKDVNSPHLQQDAPEAPAPPPAPTVVTPTEMPAPAADPAPATDDLASARDAVMQAINGAPPAPEPIQALNAQPLGTPLHQPEMPPELITPNPVGPAVIQPTQPQQNPDGTPPAGPPPMMPPAFQ